MLEISLVNLSSLDLFSFVGVLWHLTCPFPIPFLWSHQREGMGLLDYQAMPALRDVALDGVLCSFSNRCARPGLVV
jgi:hypothetical protein